MDSSRKTHVTIRRGTSEDIEPILELLTEYELPRSYFEPFYLNDTSYLPEQSWVVEQDGRLVSHLRVFDRWIRVGRTKLHVAGIGNVITARDARGHGYAGQIMRVMLPELQREAYAYSLLGTHIPNLYMRYGWVPIEQEILQALLPPSIEGSVTITPFQEGDFQDCMRLYDENNAERTGTIIRTPEYWRDQTTWIQGENFLVARDPAEGRIVGYVRSRALQNAIEVLELGSEGVSLEIGRTLLAVASMPHDGYLQGQLPRSLRGIFLPGEFEVVSDPGLMGRVIDLAALLHALQPLWSDRIREASISDGAVRLSTMAGPAAIYVQNGNMRIDMQDIDEHVPSLSEGEFAHLLFHGFDERADTVMGDRLDAAFLRVLFPEQDFVTWQADAF